MAIFYGRDLRDRLVEAGVYNDVCEAGRVVYEELRVLWQEVGQRIGKASGYLKAALDRGVELPEEARDFAITLAEDELRRGFYTGPLREFLELVFSGGRGSAGGLGLVAYACGFHDEARFLISRKELDENVERALVLVMEAADFIERYADSSIDGVVGLVEELNDVVNEVAWDVMDGKSLFNITEVRSHAEAVKHVLWSFARDAWGFIGAL